MYHMNYFSQSNSNGLSVIMIYMQCEDIGWLNMILEYIAIFYSLIYLYQDT